MHGPEAASKIRKDLNYQGVIIGNQSLLCSLNYYPFYYYLIGITGNALPDDVADFIASGANEVLIKPITKGKLINQLLQYL